MGLRDFLFVATSLFAFSTGDAGAMSPSFDCAKAKLPTERAICKNDGLARSDLQTTEAFEQAKRVSRKMAIATARVFLKARNACGADIACIARAQEDALVEFAIVGARAARKEPDPPPVDTARQMVLQNAWERCLEVFALTVAKETNEPATVIVEGAMTACQAPADDMFNFFNNQEPKALAEFTTTQLLPAMAEDYRKKTLAKVLAYRAAS